MCIPAIKNYGAKAHLEHIRTEKRSVYTYYETAYSTRYRLAGSQVLETYSDPRNQDQKNTPRSDLSHTCKPSRRTVQRTYYCTRRRDFIHGLIILQICYVQLAASRGYWSESGASGVAVQLTLHMMIQAQTSSLITPVIVTEMHDG